MATSSVTTVQVLTTMLIEEVYSLTDYEPELLQDAEIIYDCFKKSLSDVVQSSDGEKLITKYTVLAATVNTEETFNDMVKIIWRMVKEMGGTAQHKMCLFFLGVGTIYSVLKQKGDGRPVQTWLNKVERWLGNQLTIGGKGVAGKGEGTVHDRIQRFFSTPYLHDFD